jgi:hypothetical protein
LFIDFIDTKENFQGFGVLIFNIFLDEFKYTRRVNILLKGHLDMLACDLVVHGKSLMDEMYLIVV